MTAVLEPIGMFPFAEDALAIFRNCHRINSQNGSQRAVVCRSENFNNFLRCGHKRLFETDNHHLVLPVANHLLHFADEHTRWLFQPDMHACVQRLASQLRVQPRRHTEEDGI